MNTVSFTINGTAYSGTVDSSSNFSIDVAGSDLAADTSFDATVTGTDNAGNSFSATTTSTHTVNTSAAATISVDNITADDIINATEAAGTVAVTGSVGGDAAQVTPSPSPSTAPPTRAPLIPAGDFSIDVAGSDLAADTSFDATVTGTDNAGNSFSATTTSTHTVNTSASATISVDNITADDIINATEAAGTVAVTGSVGGDAAQVTPSPSPSTAPPTRAPLIPATTSPSTSLALTSPLIHPFDATVTGTDNAGNSFSATTTSTYTVDTSAAATISVDNITADDIINATEAAGTVAVTGSVPAMPLQVTPSPSPSTAPTYSGTVDSSGDFSIDVAGSDLAADTSFRCHRHRHR